MTVRCASPIIVTSEGFDHHAGKASNGFHGRVRFLDIFQDAIDMIFDKDHGLIQSGKIWSSLEALIDWNPDSSKSPIGFTRNQAMKYLYYGDFEIKFYNSFSPGIITKGPILSGPNNQRKAYAVAEVNGSKMWFNFYVTMSDASSKLPNTPDGVQQCVYFVGAILLHELMHIYGFKHASIRTYEPDSPYTRTLPQVAYRAVLRSSPYWGSTFSDERDNPFSLVDIEDSLGLNLGLYSTNAGLERELSGLHCFSAIDLALLEAHQISGTPQS
jgi:hypothetical protein